MIVSEVISARNESKMKDFAIDKMNQDAPAGKWDDEAGYDIDDPMMDYSDDLQENKLGASTMKKSSDKKDNTQMGYKDKNITSTAKPTEKKEGKKLPVKDSTKNTEKNHVAGGLKSTPALPSGEKQEKARPTGGHGAKNLKEEILQIIREEIEEYRTKGALGAKNPNRVAPVKKYVPQGIAGMGRPKKADVQSFDDPAASSSIVRIVFDGDDLGEIDLNRVKGSSMGYLKAFLSGSNVSLDLYKVDQSVQAKLDEFNDAYVDDILPSDATLNLQVVGDTVKAV